MVVFVGEVAQAGRKMFGLSRRRTNTLGAGRVGFQRARVRPELPRFVLTNETTGFFDWQLRSRGPKTFNRTKALLDLALPDATAARPLMREWSNNDN